MINIIYVHQNVFASARPKAKSVFMLDLEPQNCFMQHHATWEVNGNIGILRFARYCSFSFGRSMHRVVLSSVAFLMGTHVLSLSHGAVPNQFASLVCRISLLGSLSAACFLTFPLDLKSIPHLELGLRGARPRNAACLSES